MTTSPEQAPVFPPPGWIEELFRPSVPTVLDAVERSLAGDATLGDLGPILPEIGVDPASALARVTPHLVSGGRDLGHRGFLAHMDPPTPWVAWVAALVGASTNQNLLHPDTAPSARELERRVVSWLAPAFGMDGGHLVPGSSLANLTALWAARDGAGVEVVVTSADAHLSVTKAARILGLDLVTVPPDPVDGSMSAAEVSEALRRAERPAAVVLTAGTTGRGAIDRLALSDGGAAPTPAWLHVDAAWAGPLRWSDRHRSVLDGVERADSIAVSAHKWLFQPKESAMVLFRDTERANRSISLGGAYLQVPNVGVQGSHGTAAAPLAATLLTLGRLGVAALVDHGMMLADRLQARIDAEPELERLGRHRTAVVVWRHRSADADAITSHLDGAFVSTVTIDGRVWLRSVAANPMADPDLVVDRVLDGARRIRRRHPQAGT